MSLSYFNPDKKDPNAYPFDLTASKTISSLSFNL